MARDMDFHRDRMRVYMQHIRAKRREAGLCPRCGMDAVPPHRMCDGCRTVQVIKRGGLRLASLPSQAHASS